ncbi:MAG: hypothetical protein ACHQQS_10705 [Thermoanaerobaculales bacterium]
MQNSTRHLQRRFHPICWQAIAFGSTLKLTARSPPTCKESPDKSRIDVDVTIRLGMPHPPIELPHLPSAVDPHRSVLKVTRRALASTAVGRGVAIPRRRQ